MKSVLADTLGPLLRRPPALQLAALCHRDTPQGREVLLVTSSHGRWILPKGWPIDGLDGGETALQEAWEEAGVKKGKVSKTPVGSFQSIKRFDSGQEVPCETSVYAVKVKDVANDYPEADRRERKWVPVDQAADIVDDDGLRAILTAF
ncbi:NUDIX hydrolase [Yoonia sp. R2331]|uniref:NUDIX hydrolase n=1 Tax=Yoonia sp. R2331 TaxID=3237238 RepID=UPI0034E4CA4F